MGRGIVHGNTTWRCRGNQCEIAELVMHGCLVKPCVCRVNTNPIRMSCTTFSYRIGQYVSIQKCKNRKDYILILTSELIAPQIQSNGRDERRGRGCMKNSFLALQCRLAYSSGDRHFLQIIGQSQKLPDNRIVFRKELGAKTLKIAMPRFLGSTTKGVAEGGGCRIVPKSQILKSTDVDFYR